MALPNIGLFGYAGAGKDTVAEYLISRYQYTRVAFADPLKEMALSIDPRIPQGYWGAGGTLASIVECHGWDEAKRSWPEVRRFLRSLGKTMRDRDPDYWLNIALRKIYTAKKLNMPVVVTDVRHENEFETLRLFGRVQEAHAFTMVRIDRPGTDTGIDPESGALIKSVTPDWTLHNRGSVEDLYGALNVLINRNTK